MNKNILSEAYMDGMKTAVQLIEKGVFAGLTFKDSVEALKRTILKTEAKLS